MTRDYVSITFELNCLVVTKTNVKITAMHFEVVKTVYVNVNLKEQL